MSKLVDITDRAPNDPTIQLLERLLAEAKAGELRSVLVVTGSAGDCFDHFWSKDPRSSWKRMVGEIALAQTDFHIAALDGAGSYLDRLVRGE